jgi:hypothetical protein
MAENFKQPRQQPGEDDIRPKHTGLRRNWQIMLVDDHGQIIPFRRIKGIAYLLVLIAVVALSAAIFLGLLYQRELRHVSQLNQRLEQVSKQASQLRDEKDILLTKLVVAESKLKSDEKAVAAEKEAEPRAAPLAGVPRNEPQSIAASGEQAPEKKAAPAKAAESPKAVVKVTASSLEVVHDPHKRRLSISFKLSNASTGGLKAEGRCVVVLKNKKDSTEGWLSIPQVNLSDGVPAGNQGQYFRIANFMNVQMQRYNLPKSFQYEQGALYVFDQKAKPLLKKEFSLSVSYQPPPVPSGEPEQSPLSKSPEEPPQEVSPALPAEPGVGEQPNPEQPQETVPASPLETLKPSEADGDLRLPSPPVDQVPTPAPVPAREPSQSTDPTLDRMP